ncbi:protein of unknown function [Methylocaldum szegediense]|uniref:Uncharacterized protein n=1 Tax=Methylocaldum szegediense TaxID=73780 RepID=A0ABN8X8G7_9GAMM|nr:protein of unknown function [Methylocaldum szegediense]
MLKTVGDSLATLPRRFIDSLHPSDSVRDRSAAQAQCTLHRLPLENQEAGQNNVPSNCRNNKFPFKVLFTRGNKKGHTEVWPFELLAGGPGFEPGLTESESVVLPLDDPPVVKARRGSRRALH